MPNHRHAHTPRPTDTYTHTSAQTHAERRIHTQSKNKRTVHRHELPQQGAAGDADEVDDGAADAGGVAHVQKEGPALYIRVIVCVYVCVFVLRQLLDTSACFVCQDVAQQARCMHCVRSAHRREHRCMSLCFMGQTPQERVNIITHDARLLHGRAGGDGGRADGDHRARPNEGQAADHVLI